MAMMDDAQRNINEATIMLGSEFPKDGTLEEQQLQVAKAQVFALVGIAESLKMLNHTIYDAAKTVADRTR